MKQSKKSKLSKALKKKQAAIVQDCESHQQLLDIAAYNDVYEGIRQGELDVKNGRVRRARDFFAEFESKHHILR